MHKIFDTHAHYDDHAFDEDRKALLSGLSENGVELVMNVSARLDEIKNSIALADEYDFVYAAAGVHPSEVYDLTDEDLLFIEKSLMHEKVKAVGEIGLDYHYGDTDKASQKEWFAGQIELAKKYALPVIIHSRDAAADTLDIVKECHADSVGGVVHCFSYEPEMARIYLDLGFYIGVGGVLTFKNARKLMETVAMMPIERLLLETDCPYLAPEPFRGKRNDSTLIRHVVNVVSQLKGIDEDEVRRITYENGIRMYKIARKNSYTNYV